MNGIEAGTSAPTGPGPSGGDQPPPPPPTVDPAAEGPGTARSPGTVGWGLALIAAGVLWLVSLLGVAINWEVLLPVALLTIGVTLLVWPRSAGSGLVGLGVVLLVVTLIATVLPGSASVSAGDRVYTPSAIAELEEVYDLGAGTLVLDLGELVVSETTEVGARVGMGDLVVVVPEGVRLEGRARVGMGEVELFGVSSGGIVPSVDLATGEVGARGEVLTLDLQVGLGQIEVRR